MHLPCRWRVSLVFFSVMCSSSSSSRRGKPIIISHSQSTRKHTTTMAAKQTKSASSSGPSYHRSFRLPTNDQRRAALGSFPGAVHAASSREAMLLLSSSTTKSDNSAAAMIKEEMGDLDKPMLYQQTRGSVTSRALPAAPRDEQDWLVNVPEEGQTFDEERRLYIRNLA